MRLNIGGVGPYVAGQTEQCHSGAGHMHKLHGDVGVMACTRNRINGRKKALGATGIEGPKREGALGMATENQLRDDEP